MKGRMYGAGASVAVGVGVGLAALVGSSAAATPARATAQAPMDGGSGHAKHADASADRRLVWRLAPRLSVGYLDGKRASAFAPSRALATSHGEQFLDAGQTVRLARVGHFTFSATCSKVDGGNQASVDVVADTTAGLDGNEPAPAGTSVNIHMNSDALDTTPDKPLMNGDFDQVASASSSTEIAQDGQEVDVFYNDGVNGFGHDCFAGITGLRG